MHNTVLNDWRHYLLTIYQQLFISDKQFHNNFKLLYCTGIRIATAMLFRRCAEAHNLNPDKFETLFLYNNAILDKEIKDCITQNLGAEIPGVSLNDIEFPGILYGEFLKYRSAKKTSGNLELIKTTDRRLSGAFYTPPSVTEFIVRETLTPLFEKCDVTKPPMLRICDPAMGTGNFLFESARQITHYWCKKTKNLDIAYRQKILRYIVSHCLYGVDCDPIATAIGTAQLALLAGIEPSQIRTIITADSLCNELPFDNAFDAVVGNPPWRTFGLRGVDSISPELNVIFRQKYSATAEYKISVYALFIERALQLTRPGGWHGFIVPDSWLSGKYFSKLRQFILSESAFRRLVLIEKDFWRGLHIGRCVVYVVQKKQLPASVCQKFPAATVKLPEQLMDMENKSVELDVSRINNRHLQRIVIYPDKQAREIVERMEDSGDILGNYLTFYSGLIGKRGRDNIVLRSRPDSYCPAYNGMLIESGKNLAKNKLVYDGHYIVHNPALYKSGYDVMKYRQPKLFINQTGYTLKACYDDRGFFCLNNMHIAIPARPGINMKFYAALLNSKIINFYYRVMSMEHGRALAQTDIDFLLRLPHGTNTTIAEEITQLIEAHQTFTINRLDGERIEYTYSLPDTIQNKIEILFARWYQVDEMVNSGGFE